MRRTPFDGLALVVVIIGALNWLIISLFKTDLVASIFGASGVITTGQSAMSSRVVYAIVGLAGLYSISLLFREHAPVKE